jgi:hypothetical protein
MIADGKLQITHCGIRRPVALHSERVCVTFK